MDRLFSIGWQITSLAFLLEKCLKQLIRYKNRSNYRIIRNIDVVFSLFSSPIRPSSVKFSSVTPNFDHYLHCLPLPVWFSPQAGTLVVKKRRVFLFLTHNALERIALLRAIAVDHMVDDNSLLVYHFEDISWLSRAVWPPRPCSFQTLKYSSDVCWTHAHVRTHLNHSCAHTLHVIGHAYTNMNINTI